MIKKYEVRITKITSRDGSPIVKEVPHANHYYDDLKEAKNFFDKWKPSTRLVSFRVRLIILTESVEKIRETSSIKKKLMNTKK